MAIQVASLFAAIGADLSGLNKGLSEAQGKLRSAGKGMAMAGAAMSAAITAPLVALGKKALTVAGDFEQSAALLGIALRGTGTDMEQVRQYALQMGADTVFGAQEMVDSMTGLAKAGQTWEQIAGDMTGTTGTLAAATSLAAASDLSLAEAADAVAVAIATFGLNTDDAVAIANTFVQTADASVAEVTGLVDALRNVGPTAAQFGWTLEDVNMALAILSERGIQGGEAGTALKSMMTNLMRTTPDVTGTLKALNITLYDQQGQMRSLPDIIKQLSASMAGLSEEERNNAIQTLAGTYGMKAMATLLAEGTEGWAAMTDAVAGAATAQEVADAKMGGLNGMMEQLSGSVETLMIKVGTLLIPVLSELVKNYLIPFLDKISSLNPEILKWGLILAGAAAAVGPLLLVLGALLPIIGALASPIGLVVLAIGTLVGAVAAFAALNWGTIQGFLAQFGGWWTTYGPKIKAIADDLFTRFKDTLGALAENVMPWIQTKLNQLTAWFDENGPLIEEFARVMANAFAVIAEEVAEAWAWIEPILNALFEMILGLARLIMQVATGDWAGAWDTIRETANDVWIAIKQAWNNFAEWVAGWFGTTWAATLQIWKNNWNQLVTVTGMVWDAVKKWAKEKWGEIETWFKGINLKEIGKGIIDGLWAGLKAKWADLKGWFSGLMEDLPSWAKKLLGVGSPSKVFAEIGRNITEGLALGILQGAQGLGAIVDRVTSDMASPAELSPYPTTRPAAAASSATTYSHYGNRTYNVGDMRTWGRIEDQERRQQRAGFARRQGV